MKLPKEKISEVFYNTLRDVTDGYGTRCWEELEPEEKSALDKSVQLVMDGEPLPKMKEKLTKFTIDGDQLLKSIVEGLR